MLPKMRDGTITSVNGAPAAFKGRNPYIGDTTLGKNSPQPKAGDNIFRDSPIGKGGSAKTN